MKCKNCGYPISEDKEYPKEGERGIAYFYEHITEGEDIECDTPEPEAKK